MPSGSCIRRIVRGLERAIASARRYARAPNAAARERPASLHMTRRSTAKMDDAEVRERVVDLLTGGGAHATAEDAFARVPSAARGKKPRGSPHTPWELLEHLRIAQRDILDYAIEPAPRTLEWPEDFWPPTPAPPDARAWSRSVKEFLADRAELVALV